MIASTPIATYRIGAFVAVLLFLAAPTALVATALTAPFGVLSVNTSDATSCTATDGSFEINLDPSNLGVSPYDISLDNGAIWAVNNQAPSSNALNVSGLAWGTYTLAVRDNNGDVIYPGYAAVAGCVKTLSGAANQSFTFGAVTGATGYNWTTTLGVIAGGQNTTTATFDFSSASHLATGTVCVQPTGPTCTAPPTCFDVIIHTIETDCNDGIDNDGDGLVDCLDCEDCAAASACDDTDGDGVGNFCDLDDDNDGIPDTAECPSASSGLSGPITTYSFDITTLDASSETEPHFLNSITVGGETYFDFIIPNSFVSNYTISNLGNVGMYVNGVSVMTHETSSNYDLDILPAFTSRNLSAYQQLDLNNFSDGDYFDLIYDAPVSSTAGGFIALVERRGNNELVVQALGSNGVALGAEALISTSDYVDLGVTLREIGGQNAEMALLPLEDLAPVGSKIHSLRISFGASSTSDAGDCKVFIFGDESSLICDADSDGIANSLDLDSDNDGIFDVDEAGHAAADANDDGVIDGLPAAFGANGLFDGVETSADSDVIAYTIADSESTPDGVYDVYELDSDGDGCIDAREEGVSDSDNDGIAGAGIAPVDANGLVTSITYGSPPNNTWQNPATNSCSYIAGTVFEDINYGGGPGRTFAIANTSAQASGWANLDIGIANTRVELYDAAGVFLEAVTTDANGDYQFENLAAGDYQVRFATRTARSNRGSNATGQTAYAVPTFRSIGTTTYTSGVGGADPAKEDASSNTTSANISTLNTASLVAQAVSNATISSAAVTDVDLGLSFNVVTNTNTAGLGSLYQFLLNSNELDNVNINLEDDPSGRVSLTKPAGKDVSIFEISGAGPHILTISAQLPIVTDTYTHLTGYTQPGAALGDNGSRTIQVEITGAINTIGALRCTFDHFELSGIAFHGFRKVIHSTFSGGTDIHIWGNYLGLQSDGTAGIAGGTNGYGIQINQSAGVFIGTNGDGINDANEGNIISNTRMGVFAENSSNVLIAGNWIGIEADGTTAAPNTIHGIEIDLATGQNIIGFDDTATQTNGAFFRNVISGNASNGIRIDRSNDVRISGNYVGTNASGTVAVPNDRGIRVIDGCSDILIGTDSDGTADVAERNIISGNGTAVNGGGVWIDFTGANLRNVIAGNYIGTDVTGMLAIPNLEYGVQSLRFNDFTVVGTNADGVRDDIERNVVSGNTGAGIIIREQEFSIVAGNYVGVAADGTTPLGNGGDGIIVVGTETDNISVGCGASFVNANRSQIGNIIQNNGGTGIHVTTGVESNNCLRNNIFGNNGELAIDLASKGVESNDNGDTDTGPNDLYNIPIIESSTLNGNLLTVKGYTRAGSVNDFYLADAGPSPNPLPAGYTTSFGEGVYILGSFVEGSADDDDATIGTYIDDGTGDTDIKSENRFEFTFDVSGSGMVASDRVTAIATPVVAPFSTSAFSGVTTVGTVEDCTDGIDNDLDGFIDCLDDDCPNAAPAIRINN